MTTPPQARRHIRPLSCKHCHYSFRKRAWNTGPTDGTKRLGTHKPPLALQTSERNGRRLQESRAPAAKFFFDDGLTDQRQTLKHGALAVMQPWKETLRRRESRGGRRCLSSEREVCCWLYALKVTSDCKCSTPLARRSARGSSPPHPPSTYIYLSSPKPAQQQQQHSLGFSPRRPNTKPRTLQLDDDAPA